MTNYLMRDDAPFGADVWAKIDDEVVKVAKAHLVGRRFVNMVGPLGWGIDQAPLFGVRTDNGPAELQLRGYIQLQELRQEFRIRARELVMAEQTPFDLDLGAVGMAAAALSASEADLVIGGLISQAEQHLPLGNWDEHGGPFAAVAAATAALRESDALPPYALVMSPTMYARLASLMQMGQRELEQVRSLVSAGIFQAIGVKDLGERVLVVSPAAWNFDMVVGQDMVTAYLGNDGLDHEFRIFETVALRVKRPQAIALLENK